MGESQGRIKYTAKRHIDPGQDLIKNISVAISTVAVTSKGGKNVYVNKMCTIF